MADAGLLLAGTVMDRLGLEAMIDEVVVPPGAGRGEPHRPPDVLPTTRTTAPTRTGPSGVDCEGSGLAGAVAVDAEVGVEGERLADGQTLHECPA